MSSPPLDVYVSATEERRIVHFALDPDTHALTRRSDVTASGKVGPLACHPRLPRLYGGLRDRAAVEAFAIEPRAGALTSLGSTPSGGDNVYVSLDPRGAFLFAAHYHGERVVALRVEVDGTLDPRSLGETGTRRHPHAIVVSPDGRWAFAPAKGGDGVAQLRLDAARGALVANELPYAEQPPGRGPRHLTFHPTLAVAYVVGELGSDVTVYAFDREQGRLTELQNVTTLPTGTDSSANAAADVHVTPDGRFVFASNRGHDSLARFGVGDGGQLHVAGHTRTDAAPRAFAIAPGGATLVVACQAANTVATYAIERDGDLRLAERHAVTGAPQWVTISPRRAASISGRS